MSRHKECVYRAELDMETLVWTRGKGFPLSRLESRLRCPMCWVERRGVDVRGAERAAIGFGAKALGSLVLQHSFVEILQNIGL
jgi:hypothetical protein